MLRPPKEIITALRTVLDPEVGINLVDLGLCPLGSYLQQSVERAIRARVPEIEAVEITMVWQPAWDPSMMSPDARRQLGWKD